MKRLLASTTVMCLLVGAPALALDPSWPDLQQTLYGEQVLTNGTGLIEIDAPYRSELDTRTNIGATVDAPQGRLLESVTVILDENPMPVSAVFTFKQPMTSFDFDTTMRVNGPTSLHIVAKTTDGQLIMSETFVKTSGQGACAAPPGTDPELALATLGDMQVGVTEYSAADKVSSLVKISTADNQSYVKQMQLNIDHPSHSGMQKDQITLLYIPMRYVETVSIDVDGKDYIDLTGSISLSENPQISMSVPADVRAVDVMMRDTDGTESSIRHQVPGF
ncbi:MAG: quinoprotein dehydrogenase-associated SoxYZ-like carrier [Pseudomonadota bacterium]